MDILSNFQEYSLRGPHPCRSESHQRPLGAKRLHIQPQNIQGRLLWNLIDRVLLGVANKLLALSFGFYEPTARVFHIICRY